MEDLLIALRNIAVHENYGPADERGREQIGQVVAIHGELRKRALNYSKPLADLSERMGWQMERLLQDCLNFPAVQPWLRERDGIRRRFRCRYGGSREHPEDDVQHCACTGCLGVMLHAMDTLTPVKGTVLFRTYNPDWRCTHAGAETVLIAVDWFEEGLLGPGQCLAAVREVRLHPNP